jgi:hypothetical protein
METKFCKHCNDTFTLDHFRKRKKRGIGNTERSFLTCNLKLVKWRKEYYNKNEEKIKQYQTAYTQKNKEKSKEYHKNYRKKHRESKIEYAKEYYINNREIHSKKSKNQVQNLTNNYVHILLKQKNIQSTPELINIQRNIIILKRKKNYG